MAFAGARLEAERSLPCGTDRSERAILDTDGIRILTVSQAERHAALRVAAPPTSRATFAGIAAAKRVEVQIDSGRQNRGAARSTPTNPGERPTGGATTGARVKVSSGTTAWRGLFTAQVKSAAPPT